MYKRKQATAWKLLVGMLAAAAGCGSDSAGKRGLTGAGGFPGPAASGATAAVSGQVPGIAGSSTPGTAGRAGIAGTGAITAGTGSVNAGRSGGAAGMAAATSGAGATTSSAGALAAGSGAMSAGTGAMVAGSGAMSAGMDAAPMPSGMGCTPAPTGTFETMEARGGPNGDYTIFRPRTLGENGFKHPPVAWGNGLATTPSQYAAWLNKVASNGFVVIANPGTGSDPQVVRQGLEWLIAQGKSGDYAGKLAEGCAATIGYSMGGGAAVGSGSHPDVKAVVSVHGLQDAAERVSGPLLLTTSDDDGFVTPSGFVQPCYNRSSKQPTVLATYESGNAPSFAGHLTPLGDGQQDAAPTIAWLRYWLYGDQAEKKWFFGADCTLCVKPWGKIQRKNGNFD